MQGCHIPPPCGSVVNPSSDSHLRVQFLLIKIIIIIIIITFIIILSLLKLQWLTDSPVVVVLDALAFTFVCNLCCGKM